MKISSSDQNNLVSYILLLLCLFLLIFFTKDLVLSTYSGFQSKKDLESQQVESREQWEHFTQLKKELENGQGKDIAELQKYAQDFSQDEFIAYIYEYIEGANKQGASSLIKTISFSEPTTNEIGFTEVNIDITLKVSSLATMGQILKYLISDESKYKVFITHFSFPNSVDESSFVVDIPLKIFYK